MGKRTSQMNAAKTNNKTPKESLPIEEEIGHRTNRNRPAQGPGAGE
jgi:hypothetical protein